MIPRVFIDDNLLIDSEIRVNEKVFHYLRNVLKSALDDKVILINGKDGEFLSTISHLDNKKCTLKVVEKTKNYRKENFLGLIFAPIQKLDVLIKSAVELGVTDFYPIYTKYTTHPKIDRAEGNIVEAVEQCERLDFPVLNKIDKLENVLKKVDGKIFFCEERTGENDIKSVKLDGDEKIYCLVGPEGGFSEEEKALIKQHKNVVSISLGHLILRAETAVVSVLSIVKNKELYIVNY
jgi:16S rRNA (uracil1498-N3)-methyltransferase